MGQYFKLVNVTKKEYAELPGLMKAIERVTDISAMGPLGYLLLDGPIDGTILGKVVDDNDPKVQKKIKEIKEEEKRERDSPYKDGRKWNTYRLAMVAKSHFKISELCEYAGRWAGDDVRLVGDYSDTELYHVMEDGTVVAETRKGETVKWKSDRPCKVTPIGDSGFQNHNEEAKPGDTIKLPTILEEGGNGFGTLIRYEQNEEWKDITEGLLKEFTNFVGKEWIEENHGKILRPDFVIS